MTYASIELIVGFQIQYSTGCCLSRTLNDGTQNKGSEAFSESSLKSASTAHISHCAMEYGCCFLNISVKLYPANSFKMKKIVIITGLIALLISVSVYA